MPESKVVVFFNHTFAPHDAASAVLLGDLVRAARRRFPTEVTCATPAESNEPPLEGVTVKRLAPWRVPAESVLAKLFHQIQFHIRAAWGLLFGPKPRLAVLFTDPPFIEVSLGRICRLRGIPYVVVLQELFPDLALAAHWLGHGTKTKILSALATRAHVEARRVIVISDDAARILSDRGVERITVIENWCEPSQVRHEPLEHRLSRQTEKRLVVRYGGILGMACDLEGFARGLEKLSDPKRFLFVFQAMGLKRRLLESLARRYPESFELRSWSPREAISPALADCDVHLMLTPPGTVGVIFSSKFYTAMAAGRPILFSAPEASCAHAMIRERGVGISAICEKPETLATALEQFADLKANAPDRLIAMGANGRQWTERRWNQSNPVDAYLALLEAELGETECFRNVSRAAAT